MELNKYNAAEKKRAIKRRERARKLRAAGKTWTEVGRALGGVSKQRAQQIASGK